jgi:hypothetical protein
MGTSSGLHHGSGVGAADRPGATNREFEERLALPGRWLVRWPGQTLTVRQLRELAAAREFSGDRRRCGRVSMSQPPRSSQVRTASASAGFVMGPTHRGGPRGNRSVEQGCSSTMVPGPSVRAAQVSFPSRHGADTRMPCWQRRMLSRSSCRTDNPGLAAQQEQTMTLNGRSVARRQDVTALPWGRAVAPSRARF